MNIPDNFKEWQEMVKLSPQEEVEYEKYKNKNKKLKSIFELCFKIFMSGSLLTSIITINSSVIIMGTISTLFILVGVIFYFLFKKYNKLYMVSNISDEEYYKHLKSMEEEVDDYYYFCRKIIEDNKNDK